MGPTICVVGRSDGVLKRVVVDALTPRAKDVTKMEPMTASTMGLLVFHASTWLGCMMPVVWHPLGVIIATKSIREWTRTD